ncbi:hypothetical protein IJU97_01145 [bacterium]|nr:hypothetical protein [bacterium]
MLVDWFDRQVQYWINNLFRFEIEFTFPDISYLADEINKISFDNISDIDTASLRAAENERKSENNSSENALKTQKQEQVENAQKKNPKAK